MRKNILRRPVVLLPLLLLILTAPALAHVEHGSMPDPVAVMEYRILLEFKPEDTATRNLLGMALLRQGKLDEAEKEFRLILQKSATHFDALDGLGLTLLRQKRPAEAVRPLQEAVRLRSDDIMVYLHLGQALAQISSPEEARQALRTGLNLLERQPPSPAGVQQRQDLLHALQQLPDSPGNSATLKE